MFFKDQLNNTLELANFPKRIISIVPSQSELLWDLGLRNELVGITKFCVHPKEMHLTIPRVGGTKTLNISKIRALKPDIIIGNKEENEQSQIIELQKEFKFWMSDIYNLSDSINMIEKIGELLNKEQDALDLSKIITKEFDKLKSIDKTVLYFIWKNPYMVAGKATFIGHILHRMGLRNCIEDVNGRYPQLSIDEIQLLRPEIIFLSSEPYPFKNKHLRELEILLPKTKIIIVDGELFSWYGSRLKNSVRYFNELIQEFS